MLLNKFYMMTQGFFLCSFNYGYVMFIDLFSTQSYQIAQEDLDFVVLHGCFWSKLRAMGRFSNKKKLHKK